MLGHGLDDSNHISYCDDSCPTFTNLFTFLYFLKK